MIIYGHFYGHFLPTLKLCLNDIQITIDSIKKNKNKYNPSIIINYPLQSPHFNTLYSTHFLIPLLLTILLKHQPQYTYTINPVLSSNVHIMNTIVLLGGMGGILLRLSRWFQLIQGLQLIQGFE